MTTATYNQHQGINTGNLLRAAVIAIIAAVVVNLILRTIAVSLLGVSPDLMMMNPVPIIGVTVMSLVGATVLYALLTRFTANPVRVMRVISAVVAVLSLFGPIAAASGMMPPMPNMPAIPPLDAPTLIILILMHLLTALVGVGILTTQARPEA